ncbi:MAG: preprotein translocase subunit SecG [Spirochaetes bacterium]|nr:preprotein translocase subunit SecG [Spirochaetota bacterium]
MGLLGIILLVLFVLVALLLVFMVVIQNESGDTIGGVFSGSGSSAFGSRSSSIVVRITYVLGALFFVIAFGLALVNRSDLGQVEAAARARQGTTRNNWFQAEAQSEAPLPDAAPTVAAPEAQPLPVPATGNP